MKKLIVAITLLLSSNAFAYTTFNMDDVNRQNEERQREERRNRLMRENNETLRHIEQMMQRQEIDNL